MSKDPRDSLDPEADDPFAEDEFERQRVAASSLTPVLLEKWPGKVLVEGFVPFPKRLLRGLSGLFGGRPEAEQLAVLLAIVDYRRPRVSRPPSTEYLAFLAGLSVERFEKRLRELDRKGWVSVRRTKAGLSVDLAGFLEALKEAAPLQKWEKDELDDDEPFDFSR